MKNVITFDTLEYMSELKKSGMRIEEAEAITKATAKVFTQMMQTQDISTKKDLQEMKLDLIKIINENTWKTIVILSSFQTILLGLFGFVQKIFN